MKTFKGKSVFSGVAFGELYLLEKATLTPDESSSTDSSAEWAAFEAAKQQADRELEALYEKTRAEIGEEDAQIIDIQRMMLQDGELNDAIEELIRNESCRAAHAVILTGKQFSELFASLEDTYMKARAPDVADVARRLASILLEVKVGNVLARPSVIATEDLSPSETLQLDRKFIRAFVTRKGSTNSHTAILARTLHIPALVQSDISLEKDMNGKAVAVDGHSGIVYLEPDRETVSRLESIRKNDDEEAVLLESLRGLPAITKSGKRIELFANIGSAEDAEAALAAGAEGIGLFRSEFLYLAREELPSEDEQFNAYRKVAELMDGRRVIVRTLDIGADKKAPYLNLDAEENPALGLRAIRICFDRPEIFLTQLRALYRASAFGNIAIMFPMIASVWELRKCREYATRARKEIAAEGTPVGDVPLGIMVETPAAALMAGDLAAEADFFSVGTNDLTQYTLAADRQNPKLEAYANPRHPAVLAFLEMIAKSAKNAGIQAGICGELASDPALTGRFIEWGYNELSVSPAFIPALRKKIRDMD
jgi:phosphotransferase system enzyme I (PtsI)